MTEKATNQFSVQSHINIVKLSKYTMQNLKCNQKLDSQNKKEVIMYSWAPNPQSSLCVITYYQFNFGILGRMGESRD